MTNRDDYITGLRQFADWLEKHPQVQAFQGQNLLLALTTNSAVDEFAAEHGLIVSHDAEGNASCDVKFGPVVYHAYGYVDFDEHFKAAQERQARSWAQKNGMDVVPTETESSQS